MLALLAASIVAVSSDCRSGVSGNPLENRIRVFRPGTLRRDFARLRIAINSLRAAKSDLTCTTFGAPIWATSVVCPGSLVCTAENLTPLTARLRASEFAVKFCVMWKAPVKSATAIKRSLDALFSTNWAAAWRARVCSEGLMVALSKNRTRYLGCAGP